jgi:hypothetical protein
MVIFCVFLSHHHRLPGMPHIPRHSCTFIFNDLTCCSSRNPFFFKLLHCCPGVYPPRRNMQTLQRASGLCYLPHSYALANAQFANPFLSDHYKLPGGVPPSTQGFFWNDDQRRRGRPRKAAATGSEEHRLKPVLRRKGPSPANGSGKRKRGQRAGQASVRERNSNPRRKVLDGRDLQ